MKKFLRVVVPLLLILAVIGCSVWYLTVYDRDFTRDMLLQQARLSDARGNHSLAAWLYNLAYDQSGSVDDIAIELAEQYISVGNYTKAEYTISKAIAENPSAKLYMALCRLFVRQDKLMDAVNMLDTIGNPEIKAQVDAQRPAVPQVSPAPDFYTQYIDVSVQVESSTVYVSRDGVFPSKALHTYHGPISLELGQTMLYALAIGENGLVSPLGVYGYTVGGIIEEVTFADPAMEAAIRQILGVEADEPVFSDQLWNILDFTIPAEAQKYSDLSRLQHLKTLTAENAVTEELIHLSALTDLEEIHLLNCHPTDDILRIIATLPKLHTLTLQSCGLSSISALSGASNLQVLNLSDNTLRNLSPLAGMKDLRVLNLAQNAVTELTALGGFAALEVLNIAHNSVASLEPICGLTNLTSLNASYNKLTGIGSLNRLTALEYLDLSQNTITDVSVLGACLKLTELDLSNNALTDITALAPLDALYFLDFSYNSVAALPVFTENCQLVTVDGSHNLLSSVAELAVLSELNNALLDYNEALEDLSPLDKCHCLILVNAYGTKVSDVSFLTEKSIIVNYNPVLEE